jgi:hypothetical protein
MQTRRDSLAEPSHCFHNFRHPNYEDQSLVLEDYGNSEVKLGGHYEEDIEAVWSFHHLYGLKSLSRPST